MKEKKALKILKEEKRGLEVMLAIVIAVAILSALAFINKYVLPDDTPIEKDTIVIVSPTPAQIAPLTDECGNRDIVFYVNGEERRITEEYNWVYIERDLDKNPCNLDVVGMGDGLPSVEYKNLERYCCHTISTTTIRLINASRIKRWGFYPRNNLSRFIEINGTECRLPCFEKVVFCYNDDCSDNCTGTLPIQATVFDEECHGVR